MPKNIVVIGASAGGLEALKILLKGLPEDFAASVFIVMHISPQSPGVLDQILGRGAALPVISPHDGEHIESGRIYVAPPDYHLILEPGVVRLTRGPRENLFRPAVDPLFRSAAQVYGPRVVGVILTGGLDDGTAGLWAVKRLGGTAIVQDPEEAPFPSMPSNAMRHVQVDYCLRLGEIAGQLVRLASEAAEEGDYSVPDEMDIEIKIAKERPPREVGVFTLGEPSTYSCPECHGVLLKLKESSRTRFRCHTGHAYSADSLLADLSQRIDETLWSSIRSIEESVMLLRHIGEHLDEELGVSISSDVFFQKAQEAQRRAELLRHVVMEHEELSTESVIVDQDDARAR